MPPGKGVQVHSTMWVLIDLCQEPASCRTRSWLSWREEGGGDVGRSAGSPCGLPKISAMAPTAKPLTSWSPASNSCP